MVSISFKSSTGTSKTGKDRSRLWHLTPKLLPPLITSKEEAIESEVGDYHVSSNTNRVNECIASSPPSPRGRGGVEGVLQTGMGEHSHRQVPDLISPRLLHSRCTPGWGRPHPITSSTLGSLWFLFGLNSLRVLCRYTSLIKAQTSWTVVPNKSRNHCLLEQMINILK